MKPRRTMTKVLQRHSADSDRLWPPGVVSPLAFQAMNSELGFGRPVHAHRFQKDIMHSNDHEGLPSRASDYLGLIPVLILLALFAAGFIIFHVNATAMDRTKGETVTPSTPTDSGPR